MAEHHEVKFERNRLTNMHRAICTCGWFLVGTQEHVTTRAATHDLEWEPVTPAPKKEDVA